MAQSNAVLIRSDEVLVLKRIAIDNFRCFSNFEFLPSSSNLLFGGNGSGKSTLFEALYRLRQSIIDGQEIGEVFPASCFTRWDKRNQMRIELDLALGPDTYNYLLIVERDAAARRSWIKNETVMLESKVLLSFIDGKLNLRSRNAEMGGQFAFRPDRSFLPQVDDRFESTDLFRFLEAIRGLSIYSLDARRVKALSQAEETRLNRDGSNFASYYRHFVQEYTDASHALFSALRGALTGFETLRLQGSGEREKLRELKARFSTGSSAYDVYFDELSAGQKQLAMLYTILQTQGNAGNCLWLDEPESHVSLTEIQPWLVELDERLEAGGQVFIASQHSDVVNYMAAGESFVFERPDGGPTRIRRANFYRDEGLSAAEQISRGLLVAE